MSEHTDPTTPATGQTGTRYRVTGHLPMTITVAAGTPFQAETAARNRVAAALADHDDVALVSVALATAGFAATGDPTGSPQPTQSTVRILATGHVTVVADDTQAAARAALDTVTGYLTTDNAITVLGDEAVCDAIEPITDHADTE